MRFLWGMNGIVALLLAGPWLSASSRKIMIDMAACLGPLIAALWAFWPVKGVRASRTQNAAGVCLGLGALGYAIGTGIWIDYELIRHQDCPFPSWADAGYLGAYPFLYLGILMMPRTPLPAALRGRVLLDGLMVMAAVVTFSWYFILGPTIHQGAETFLGKIIGAAYPINDLILLFCLMALTAYDGQRRISREVTWISVGLLAVIAADVAFGYLTLKQTYVSGQLTDLGWPLGYMLIGLAGCSLRRSAPVAVTEEDASARNPVLWRSLLPYLMLPAVGGLLLWMQRARGDEYLEPGVYLGSALLIALLIVRQVFAILENSKLYRFLQSAYAEMEEMHGALEVKNRSLEAANARLEALATTDGLTGLKNHRAFQEKLDSELRRASRYGEPVSLVMLDVDRFKQFNDTFGHPAGDAVLRAVADTLAEQCRDTDFAARYGGEEFVIILPQTDGEGALALAERFRAAIEARPWDQRAVTASFGVATSEIGIDPAHLLSAADEALYRSKQGGRNRVTHAGILMEGGCAAVVAA